VARRRKSLLNYMLFLRLTPTLPNTFINFASPIVDVPYHIFLFATVIGLIPAAYVTVKVRGLPKTFHIWKCYLHNKYYNKYTKRGQRRVKCINGVILIEREREREREKMYLNEYLSCL